MLNIYIYMGKNKNLMMEMSEDEREKTYFLNFFNPVSFENRMTKCKNIVDLVNKSKYYFKKIDSLNIYMGLRTAWTEDEDFEEKMKKYLDENDIFFFEIKHKVLLEELQFN